MATGRDHDVVGLFGKWVQRGQEMVSVLIPATTNLVLLAAALEGKNVPAEEVENVEKAGMEAAADLRIIGGLLSAYEAADAGAKPGVLKKIENAIAAVEGNLQGLMAGLHIKDPGAQSKIAAVVGIVLVEVQSLAALLPLVQGQGAEGGGRGADSRVRGAAIPRKHALSAGEFVQSYNAAMTGTTGRAEWDGVTGELQIHLGSTAER